MTSYEPLGYLASSLVLTTFWMRAMLPLRVIAIASNVAFISYGLLAGIMPVLLLHLLLLPMNLFRLAQSLREHSPRDESSAVATVTHIGAGRRRNGPAGTLPNAIRAQASAPRAHGCDPEQHHAGPGWSFRTK